MANTTVKTNQNTKKGGAFKWQCLNLMTLI